MAKREYSTEEKIAHYHKKLHNGTKGERMWAGLRLKQLRGEPVGKKKPKFNDEQKREYYIERLKNGTGAQKKHAVARLRKLGQGDFDFI